MTTRKTYREVIEGLKTVLDRQGTPSDDNRWSSKLIYHTLLDQRTTYLKNAKIQRKGIGPQNIQTIPCVKLEKADKNIAPCNPPSGCKWLKSVEKIPKTISLQSVTNSLANYKAEYVEWNNFKHKLSSRSNKVKKAKYYTFLDTGDGSYLYLYNEKFLKSVALTGLFEDPNKAATFGNIEDLSEEQKFLKCNPMDTPVYADGDIVEIIFKLTHDFLMRSTGGALVDTKNDSLSEDALDVKKRGQS